nr:unnamed protein product [Callosobruchus chinensis]
MQTREGQFDSSVIRP